MMIYPPIGIIALRLAKFGHSFLDSTLFCLDSTFWFIWFHA